MLALASALALAAAPPITCRVDATEFSVSLPEVPDRAPVDAVVTLPARAPIRVPLDAHEFAPLAGVAGDGPCRGTGSVALPGGRVAILLQRDGRPNLDHLAGFLFDPRAGTVVATWPDLGPFADKLLALPDGLAYATSNDGQCGGEPPAVPGHKAVHTMCSSILEVWWTVRITPHGVVRAYDRDHTYAVAPAGYFSSRDEFERAFLYDARQGQLGRTMYQTWALADGGLCMAAVPSDTSSIPLADIHCKPPGKK